MEESTTGSGEGVEDGAHRALERLPLPQLRPGDYTGQSNAMNDPATKPRLSQESITILSVGGALLGTAVALGALILSTTGRIEHRIERVEDRIGRVEHRIERVEDRLLAVEKETASLRVDVTELRAGLDRRKSAATGTATEPSASTS